MSAELATVSFRTESGVTENESWTAVGSAVLSNTVPWRTFRWYKGQRHYSGVYWSATMRDHVVYESRLELARLIFADFDRSVHRILAQPFLLKAKVGGKIRKHAGLLPGHRSRSCGRGCQTRIPAGQADGGLHVRMDPAAGEGAGLAVRGLERGTLI